MRLHLRPIGPLDPYLVYWLRFVAAHATRALGRRTGKFGVSASEWIVLRELHRLGGCSPRALAAELGMSQAAISRLVKRLDARELVVRSPVERGKQQWDLCLSALGRALVPTLEEVAREADARFFENLAPAEREQLASALKRLVRRRRLKPIAPE